MISQTSMMYNRMYYITAIFNCVISVILRLAQLTNILLRYGGHCDINGYCLIGGPLGEPRVASNASIRDTVAYRHHGQCRHTRQDSHCLTPSTPLQATLEGTECNGQTVCLPRPLGCSPRDRILTVSHGALLRYGGCAA